MTRYRHFVACLFLTRMCVTRFPFAKTPKWDTSRLYCTLTYHYFICVVGCGTTARYDFLIGNEIPLNFDVAIASRYDRPIWDTIERPVFFLLLLPFFLFCPLWEHGLVRCVNRTFFTLGIGRVNWSSLFPRGSIMYEEQIKLKAYSPWSRLVKESKSSALVPHIYEFSVDRLVHR